MLLTRAESTSFRETSLHADVMRFVRALEARNDPRLHVTTFGTSPGGRDLPLLILSKDHVRTPEEARRKERPVVLMLDGIHPGEVEGKEASLALVRDLLDGRHPDWLDTITLLVAPLFNPDGNDALDPVNRRLDLKKLSGQIGPVVGTRTQSHGINLNRDYMRQAAPEMRALQDNVCLPWAPDLTIDNHATNGSVHRFHMTVDVPHTVASGRREPIDFMRERLVPEVIAAVRARGFESGWYGNFVEDERVLDAGGEVDAGTDVGLGWMTYPHHPRFGSNYRGLTNRLDLLLECYSYLPFEERVRTATAWQIETLSWAAKHADDIRQVVASSAAPPDRVAVRYRLDRMEAPVSVLTRSPRTLEGAPVAVQIPYLGRFEGTVVVDRPRAYLVPPAVAEHLRRHGLRVGAAEGVYDVEVARVTSLGTEGGRGILEAAAVGEVAVEWRKDRRTAPAGWSRVDTDQPLGAIAVYLCEPESDDGAVENGLLPVPAVGDEHPVLRVR
ncbi:M14 family metallopeptidase [Polyangium sorediatum]|uniref:M14 family metallopeptidase n=1 Tax=Polyangium sorediatum TaxID=889274 RepID=A0ABT6NLG3_9BACT|nr:M14 family metallopeptidase [Polyangium sorediatum]MDI1429156.1 M14 family metallopeptidase [Polyangium sorediatum]